MFSNIIQMFSKLNPFSLGNAIEHSKQKMRRHKRLGDKLYHKKKFNAKDYFDLAGIPFGM